MLFFEGYLEQWGCNRIVTLFLKLNTVVFFHTFACDKDADYSWQYNYTYIF